MCISKAFEIRKRIRLNFKIDFHLQIKIGMVNSDMIEDGTLVRRINAGQKDLNEECLVTTEPSAKLIIVRNETKSE